MNSLKTSSAAIALTFLGTIVSAAQQKQITRSQLPQPVAATVDQETNGATIKSFAMEREHGKIVYEAETVVNNRTRDLQIASDGTLTEIEEEVVIEALKTPVRTAITSRAKDWKVTKVESLTKNGKLVAYEATMTRSGRSREIQVGPDGGNLTHEE